MRRFFDPVRICETEGVFEPGSFARSTTFGVLLWLADGGTWSWLPPIIK